MTVDKNDNASKRHITEVNIRTAAATRPAPPAYRPQQTPKVLQRKAETTPRARLPIAQTKVAPASQSVLQAKQTATQKPASSPSANNFASSSRKPAPPGRAPSVSLTAPRVATTIQRAVAAPDAKCATSVVATFPGVPPQTGHSGQGPQTGELLSTTQTAAARKFLQILRAVKRKDERTGFTCAEPNAVAKLLAERGGPVTEDDLWFRVKVNTAWDSRGGKSACVVCKQWLENGSIIDITASGAAVSASGAKPKGLTLLDFMKKAPAKKGGGGGGAAAGGGGGGGLPPPAAAT